MRKAKKPTMTTMTVDTSAPPTLAARKRGHEPDDLPVVAVDTLDDAEEALAVLAEDGDLSALPTCGDAQD